MAERVSIWCLGSVGEIWGKSPRAVWSGAFCARRKSPESIGSGAFCALRKSPRAVGSGAFCALRKSPEAVGFGAFCALRSGCVSLDLLVLWPCSSLFLWALEMSGMGLGRDRWHSSRGGVQFEPYM